MLEETYITTTAETADLKVILDKISRETGFLFTYPENLVRDVRNIAVPAGTRTVSAMLDLVLRNTGLRYWQSNRMIALFKDLEQKPEEPEVRRTYTVRGGIADQNGMPLAGATVVVKGEGTYTVTDPEGKFAVKATGVDVLVVSLLSYRVKEVMIGGRAVVDIQLEEDAAVLSEIVVNAGYWNVKERENTGNISWLSEEAIRRQPVTNPLGLLSGQMPGVFAQQRSGVPGGGYDLTIRGRNSLRGEGNYPLYLIDGVPFPAVTITSLASASEALNNGSPLNNVNVGDIERIEILKDADATAIYGSRGANGVVLITTRKGRPGKTGVDLNVYQGVGQVTRTMQLLNTQQWVEMRKEAFRNDAVAIQPEHVIQTNAGPKTVYSNAPDLTEWDTTRYTDWQKKFLGDPARITQVHLSVNSGTEQTQFYLGGSFYRETTVFPGDFGMLKGSGHFNLNHRSVNDRFRLGLTTSYVIIDNELPRIDFTRYTLTLPPNAPDLYNEDGTLNRSQPQYLINPAMNLNSLYKGASENLMVSGFFGYEVLRGLTLKNTFGYTQLSARDIGTTPISAQPFDPSNNEINGFAVYGNNSIHTWISEPQLEFERLVGPGTLSVLAGATYQESILAQTSILASGYTSDALIENLTAATVLETIEDNYARYRYNAVFGRINYNWDGKYILNITGRRDGSSRFGPGNRYATFGAVGASWVFSREPWIEDRLRWLSFGRLRASYGTTGSDQIGDYQFLDAYASNDLSYYGTSTIAPTRLVNSKYSWEVNHKLEAALRLDAFRDRLMVEASWYRNLSTNQLIGKELSEATGFSEVQWNAPVAVLNTGWELVVSSVNISTDNFSWRSSVNVTLPKNKLLSFPGLESSSYANTYAIGYPLSMTKTYRFTGVDPQTGLYTFDDVNNDGLLNKLDRQPTTMAISMYGGFQNTILYKAWEFNVHLQWVKWDGLNGLGSSLAVPGAKIGNQPSVVMNRWEGPGDEGAAFQRFTRGSTSQDLRSFIDFKSSDRMISDASYLRVKNVSLAYHLRPAWAERLHLKQCKVYAQAQNLATWTNYLGADPEIQNARVAPPLRVVSLGVQLTL